MSSENSAFELHPQGEAISGLMTAVENALSPCENPQPLRVQTPGGTVYVEWDPQSAVTPVGQLVFFAQFLEVSGIFEALCQSCPVRLSSPNAPSARDVLGTLLMGVLCGQWRYAHLSALRFDPVNPGLLGMSKVVSEDSARRYLGVMSDEESAQWLRGQLRRCWGLLLQEPWVLDIDTTIKPIYGHQQGALKGYNPTKPGRPSLAYHTYFIGTLRVCLDVEVESGNRCAAKHGHAGLWRLLEELPASERPAFIRGDLAYGEQKLMAACEERGQKYLFKLRQSPKVKELVRALERQSGWQQAGQSFEGLEGSLKLKAWSCERRIIVLRRRINQPKPSSSALPLLAGNDVELNPAAMYEYMVLVTNLELPIMGLAQLYRDRADVENCFDELKNQWGWGGFTTRDLSRSQTMARLVGLVYNWWSLFVGLLEPDKHAEAITSRPALLHGVARATQSGRQTTLTITSTHGKAAQSQEKQTIVGRFLGVLKTAAEQLDRAIIWWVILSRVFVRFLRGRFIGTNQSLPT